MAQDEDIRQVGEGKAGEGNLAIGTDEMAGPSAAFLRWGFAAPFLLWLIVVLGALFGRPPTAPAELESLAAAWHMWQNQIWMPLHIGTGSGDQPPLHLWTILLGWQVLGIGDLWPRILSVACSLGTLWLAGRTALILWPHRRMTELYARILLSGVIAFALIATMVQAEPLGLFFTAAGFHAVTRLWHGEDQGRRRPLWWAVFAAALLASLFSIGIMTWAMLPLIAALAPRRGRNGTGPARVAPGFVPSWHVPLLLSFLPAIGCWIAWTSWLRRNGIEAGYLSFGNGWLLPATEASRREIWSLVLAPALLYPWICWKTLWRALEKQLRGRAGRSFRLCLAFLAATVAGGLVSGWQMQGMIYIVLPLSLLGARLLATQEIRAKDFHAIVPALLALLLGLFFFLMNIVPTAHLDALWRQVFDVPLPIWIGGIGMTSGLVLLVAGYGIAQLSPMHLLSRTIQVATLPVLLMTCVNIEFPFNLRQFFDLEPVAERMKELEDAGQPLAVYGPYRGEFDFYGRLSAAPISLPDRDAAIAWARANPAGVIVSYFDGSPLRLPALPYYRGVARDRWVAIWPASAVLATDGATLNSNF
ncbi:ArnT family glycosyltransferase [Dongia sp.]|uniref:ArnT family glycosyltransferase n=1 Tax=Dongia sp. TaxID=1977262 RepID=UPI0035B14A26